MKTYNMDDILNASFGESGSTLRATFKKTVLIKPYETEVVELGSVLNVDKPLNGIERTIISALLQAQLEYAGYAELAYKGYITGTEFEQRKKSLVDAVNSLLNKGYQITGKDMGYLLEISQSATVEDASCN